MKRHKRLDPIYKFIESYDLLIEIMESPQKQGYIALIKKIRFGPREPINLKLFDFKKEIDYEIKNLTYKILRKIGLDKLPDGIKE
ncbi:unnamed protein product [marine sediment metagenome]|uniref:Uncharacterized protein n=1 Tax=marine sediment metagenome TaxID=412755 RepID=X1UTW0_9ZZZZ